MTIRQGNVCAHGRGFNAGQRADAREDSLPEIQDGGILGVLRGTQAHVHREHAIGPKSGIDR